MKLVVIPAFLLCLQSASATVATLGTSNQNFALAGFGGNAFGDGQSVMTWGACTFDGTNTTCTVSGPFTGFGGGGTYSFVITYPGNGRFPLNAISQSPGSDLFVAQAVSNFSLVITLTETSGTKISFYSFANFQFFFSSPVCTGVQICSVGQVGLTPGATITGPITGTFDPTPSISVSGVITAGQFGAFAAISPGTWIEIYGVNLATVPPPGQTWAGGDFNGNQAPSTLGGTTVTVAGKPAFVDYVSPGQVNAQVPSGIAAGPQPVVVTTAGGTSAPYTATVNLVEPGLLAPPGFKVSAGQYVVAQFPDGVTYVLPPGAFPGLKSARAKPGDTIILYGVGFGPVTPDNPAGLIEQQTNALQSTFRASFAGVPATVNYAGLAPNFVGLYQFNVVVPSVAAGDAVPFAFTLGGSSTGGSAASQTFIIAISN